MNKIVCALASLVVIAVSPALALDPAPASPAAAAATPTAAAPAVVRKPSFVSPEQTRAMQILVAPPAADSDVTKAELVELHAIEKSRTPAQAEQAIWDDKNEHFFIFKNVMGDAFTEEKLPTVAAFGKRVRNDEGLNSGPAKQGFARVRPYNLDKTLNPICKTKTKDDSYPSGHTTTGFLLGLTLAEMVPEKRDAILTRAEQYGQNRLVCGVHYASDIPASRLVAYTTHAIMKQHPDYQKELAAARTELRAALGLPVAN
jgi:acid phosphatase (class A)